MVPAEVRSWVTGTGYSNDELRRLFTPRFARRLDQQGYVRFRHWRIYGERGLAGEQGAVWLYGEHLTVHFAEEPLAQYEVSYERDQKRLKTVTEPRLLETQFISPQLMLWELGPEGWHLVLRLPEYAPRQLLVTAWPWTAYKLTELTRWSTMMVRVPRGVTTLTATSGTASRTFRDGSQESRARRR